MENKELKKQLEKHIKDLKSLCKDSKFADKLIADILSVKGQIDVQPMEVCVPKDDVKDRINIRDAYEVIRFDGGYIFATNGYRIIVKPYRVVGDNVVASSLYYAMEALFSMKEAAQDNKELEVANQMSDLLKDAIPLLCTRPNTCFDTLEEIVALTEDELKRLDKKINDSMANLAQEDTAKNEEFKADVELGETLKEIFDVKNKNK